MATIKLRDNQQVIDYLARDYQSIRKALFDLIPAKLPEWTDRSEADFGIVLIELFAYMADILSYYQDRIANEAFLKTAQERRSVVNLLRLIGYEMAPAASASAYLSVVVANNASGTVVILPGDQFSTPSTGSSHRAGAKQAVCLLPRWNRTPAGVNSTADTGNWETAPLSYSTSTGTSSVPSNGLARRTMWARAV